MNEKQIADKMASIFRGYCENPKFDAQLPGHFDQQLGMAAMLAACLPRNNTKEILDKFETALAKNILAALRTNIQSRYFCISVNYDPCETIRAAAEEVGLKMKFPWKTTVMAVNDYEIESKCGYAAPRTKYMLNVNNEWEKR